MPLVVARRVMGPVESIALLPPPVANSKELCRFETQIGCCVTGADWDQAEIAYKSSLLVLRAVLKRRVPLIGYALSGLSLD